MSTSPQPGLFVKGDAVRFAQTPAQAVQAAWDGFVAAPEQVETVETPYADLQAQAKALGIPANQSAAKLAEAIANFEPEPEVSDSEVQQPDTDA